MASRIHEGDYIQTNKASEKLFTLFLSAASIPVKPDGKDEADAAIDAWKSWYRAHGRAYDAVKGAALLRLNQAIIHGELVDYVFGREQGGGQHITAYPEPIGTSDPTIS